MTHPTCCLMRARNWDVAEKLLRLIQPLDYYPLLRIHELWPCSWSCIEREVGLETSQGHLSDFVILRSSESQSLSVSVLIHCHICKEIWFKLNLNMLFHFSLAQLGLNNFVFTMDKNIDKNSSPFSTDNHVKLSEVVPYLNFACPHKFKMPDLMCIETIARLPFICLEIEFGSIQFKTARLNFQMWVWSTFKERPADQTHLYQTLRDPQINENKWKTCSRHVAG